MRIRGAMIAVQLMRGLVVRFVMKAQEIHAVDIATYSPAI
jgi:hypothetical protein